MLSLAGLVASAAGFALLYKMPGDWSWSDGSGYKGISPSSSRRPSAESVEHSAAEGLTCSAEVNSKAESQGGGYLCSLLLLLVSHFLFNIGIFTAFSFTSDRAVQRGLDLASSSLLLSLMGVSNCAGRVLFGLLLDRCPAILHQT